VEVEIKAQEEKVDIQKNIVYNLNRSEVKMNDVLNKKGLPPEAKESNMGVSKYGKTIE
jgi:hypothetical protein